MTSGRARAAFSLLAGVMVAVSAGALGMTAVAAGAPPGGPAANTAPAVPAPATVAVTPCSPQGGACTVAPKTVTLSGTLPTEGGVKVTWTTPPRPPGTPGPAQTSYLLTASTGCRTGATTCSWPWPSALEVPGSPVVLNGTYQTASCSAATTCGPASNVLIAAPPAPPGGARASGPSASVTVTWTSGVEPDLAGYTVTRNGVVVYACNLHGATLPGSVPCGRLAYTDGRGASGAVTYGIVAKRFGVDSNPAHYLSSSPAVASVTLGSSSTSALPPIPVIGIPSFPLPVAPPTTLPSPGSATAAPTTTVDPGSGGLEYGPQDHAGAAGPAPGVKAGHATTNVSRPALIAVGLLVLALAAHLLYLRGAVARYQMARGGPVTRAAHRRRRPPMRVQWGQWPPLVRDGGDLSSPG
ncbi:MAG: hypothetical protein M3Y36_07245 [Actinomycetota bacterium]|nr:hypothetical protein [Actinomycetota bacterium]